MRGSNNALYFLHSDHLGSTSLTTNSSGAVLARQSYYPYGRVRVAGNLLTNKTYTGQYADAGTGLMYYNARYYAPGLGRFISADTLIPDASTPQAFNRYAYTLNNPLRYTDATGHFTEDEIERYLEYEMGISDVDERARIIATWQNSEWWALLLVIHLMA